MESFTKTLPRVDPEVCEAADEIVNEAIRIFRVVHGPGDDGSENAFYCQNVALCCGWNILAAEILKLKKAVEAKKTKKKTHEQPNSPSGRECP